MARIVHLDGRFMDAEEARVSAFDRGFIFGDGAYEVIPVIDGRLADAERMLARLDHSLSELGIAWPMDREAFLAMHEELIARNHLREGIIYSQITRGVAERDFAFPANARPTVFAFAKALDIIDNPRAQTGIAVALTQELRWKRRDIKSIALLAQVLAKQQAAQQGAAEAWMVEDGLITEGASSSAFIVRSGAIITSPLEVDGRPRILPGIRRAIILEIAEREGIPVILRPFSPEEAKAADEAFTTAATFGLLPVVEIDGARIGSGQPGPIAARLRQLFFERLGAAS